MAGTNAEPRKAEDVLAEIQAKLATVDGIATADAFALGRLVMEYGQACAAKASADILVPLMTRMIDPPEPKRPW